MWRHQATPARKSCNNTCFISFQLLARLGSAAAGSGVSAHRIPPNQPPGPAPGSAQASADVYKAVYHIYIMRFTRANRSNSLPFWAHWTPYMACMLLSLVDVVTPLPALSSPPPLPGASCGELPCPSTPPGLSAYGTQVGGRVTGHREEGEETALGHIHERAFQPGYMPKESIDDY